MRPNEQKYKSANRSSKKKVKPLKQAEEFLFERRMKFFVSRSIKFMTIASVIGIAGFGTYLYRSEKYIEVLNYFDKLSEKFFISQGLRLEQIEVKGTKKVSEVEVYNKINEVLENVNRASLTHLPMEDIKKNIELLGWVKTAEITKLFPNKLIVKIIERTPMAIWQDKDELWLVDEYGNLVSDKIEKEYAKLPVVVSKNPIETIPELFTIINSNDIFGKNVVSAVNIGNRRWDIYLKSNIIIKLPEKDVDSAIDRLVRLQQNRNILDRNIKYIDLRLSDRIAVKKNNESDNVAEKPPVSLGSAYTNQQPSKAASSQPAPAETKQATNVEPVKLEDDTKTEVKPSEVKTKEAPTVQVAEPKNTQPMHAKTESSILSPKNKRPASFTNVNKAASKPATTHKEAAHSGDDEGNNFFKNIDGLIGN